MSAKLVAALSAAAILVSANAAFAQTKAHQQPQVAQPYADARYNVNPYFNRDYWNAVAPWLAPSDPDPVKGTVFDATR
jgi:hypothetical protein